MFTILFASILLPTVLSSYCGQSAIPFTFQVLRSGYPVLGCARPKCFGWTANGTRAGESAQFYRVSGKDDGYLRRSDQFIRPASKNANFVPQFAICADTKSKTCEEGEWVGGITPQTDPFKDEVQMRCCSYQVLISSQDRGKATVKQGQLTVGGEVLENGKLVAFDYIANLSKDVSANGTVVYYVTMKRMPCFDEADSPSSIETPREGNAVVDAPGPSTFAQQQQPQPQETLNVRPIPAQQQPQINDLVQQTQNTQAAYGTQQAQAQGYTNGQVPAQNANYGQFSQQGYGVGNQNGQYQGYPQFGQQYQYPQQQQQIQQPQQQFYQDPLTAMIQQQQQAFQQQQQVLAQQQAQQGFAQLPQTFPQQPQQQPLGLFPPAMAAGQQTVQVGGAGAGGVAIPQAQTPFTSTLAPMTLPKLEDLPKLQIPSVEDVEQVIPPVQKAILTSVAKFFGFL